MVIYLRIVSLPNDKYAVQKGVGMWRQKWEFCEADRGDCATKYGSIWYESSPDYVLQYCVVDTLEKAEETLEKTLEVLRTPSEKEQLKVIKVVKRVRV